LFFLKKLYCFFTLNRICNSFVLFFGACLAQSRPLAFRSSPALVCKRNHLRHSFRFFEFFATRLSAMPSDAEVSTSRNDDASLVGRQASKMGCKGPFDARLEALESAQRDLSDYVHQATQQRNFCKVGCVVCLHQN
jgi:hypothetical protein